jgi:two-component system sensor histidine kinase KdpD
MTRLEAGAMRLILGVCDLQDIVGVALNQMSNPLRNRSITVDVPGTLPPVSADITLMAQALVNLIDNAIKYSPPDSVIEIHAYRSEADVVVEVSDRGIGIPPDEIAHVFDKFYRVHGEAIPGVLAWASPSAGNS